VLRVTGTVRRRPEGMVNPELRSGEIESWRTKSRSQSLRAAAIPARRRQSLRKHPAHAPRVDLRREPMQKNLRLRYRVAMAVRGYLDAHGFHRHRDSDADALDARRCARLSRAEPHASGEFYALPQSPQLFKQLLMVAGFDPYYQIVPVLPRRGPARRPAAEFTQIDVETSFLDERAIQELMEGLIREVFRDVLGVELPDPFPRLSYAEVIARYGSDKAGPARASSSPS